MIKRILIFLGFFMFCTTPITLLGQLESVKDCSLECQCTLSISEIDIQVTGFLTYYSWSLVLMNEDETEVLGEWTEEGDFCFDYPPINSKLFIQVETGSCNEFLSLSDDIYNERGTLITETLEPLNYDKGEQISNAPISTEAFSDESCFGGSCNVRVSLFADWRCYTVVTPNQTSSFGIDNYVVTQQGIYSDGIEECTVNHLVGSNQNCCLNRPEIDFLNSHCVKNKESITVYNPEGGYLDYCNTNNYLVQWSDGTTGCTLKCVCDEEVCLTVTNLLTGCRRYGYYKAKDCRPNASEFLDPSDFDLKEYPIDVNDDILGLNVYPIPAAEVVYLEILNNTNNGQFHIFSIEGELIESINVLAEKEKGTTTSLNIKNYAPGVYLVHFSNGVNKLSRQFIKY